LPALEVLFDEAFDARTDASEMRPPDTRSATGHRLVLEVEEVDLLHLPRAKDGERVPPSAARRRASARVDGDVVQLRRWTVVGLGSLAARRCLEDATVDGEITRGRRTT
jgi:hypothetical protein